MATPLTTDQLQRYIKHYRVGTSGALDLPENDPTMQQAAADGLADWNGTQWIARGKIRPGERRRIRTFEEDRWCTYEDFLALDH